MGGSRGHLPHPPEPNDICKTPTVLRPLLVLKNLKTERHINMPGPGIILQALEHNTRRYSRPWSTAPCSVPGPGTWFQCLENCSKPWTNEWFRPWSNVPGRGTSPGAVFQGLGPCSRPWNRTRRHSKPWNAAPGCAPSPELLHVAVFQALEPCSRALEHRTRLRFRH